MVSIDPWMEAWEGLSRAEVAAPAQQIALMQCFLLEGLIREGKACVHQCFLFKHLRVAFLRCHLLLADGREFDQFTDVVRHVEPAVRVLLGQSSELFQPVGRTQQGHGFAGHRRAVEIRCNTGFVQ